MADDTGDEDLELIQEEARRTLAGVASPEILRGLLTRTGEFHTALWDTVAELGWLGMSLPEADGGLGMGLAERCAIAEEIGRALGSAPFTASTCAMSAVSRFGSDALKQALLPDAIAGKAILTVAAFEAGDGGLPTRPVTRFENGKLTGTKVGVSAGAFAHHALVHATGADGRNVVVAVDLGQPGVNRRVYPDSVDNSRGYADLAFDGAAGAALNGDVIHDILDELAVVSAFEQVGGGSASLYAARDYALQRRVFGQPIGAFQAIKHGLADIYVAVQVATGAARAAVRASAAELPAAAAAARVAGIRAYDLASTEGMQVFGGIGVTWEAPQHLYYRRGRCLAVEWGGEPYWRNRLLDLSIEGLAA